MKKVLRMVRQYPVDRFDQRGNGCGHTARELAEQSVAHLKRIDAIASDERVTRSATGPRPRGAILHDLETSYFSAHSSLASLSRACWSDPVRAPRGLDRWSQARRGELLWLALRELARHHRHLAMHMRFECPNGSGDDDGSRSPITPMTPQEPVAIGA
jgi:hypothetical protein